MAKFTTSHRYLILAFLILSTCCFMSCSKDDSKTSSSPIDGVWVLMAKCHNGSYNSEFYYKGKDVMVKDYIELKNGTWTSYHSTSGCKFDSHILYGKGSFTLRDKATYSVDGKKLIYTDEGDDPTTYTYELDGLKLTINRVNGYEEYSKAESIVSPE